jgi:hypothetical protein
MSTSTEMAMPGIANAYSTQPRRAPDLSSAQDLSSTAPRNCAPRNCAPRNSRRAAAPAHCADSATPNQ